ncbi:DNA adenine methylase [Lysobacter sp. 1R34A]|uniref:DNA adenine methylase n=1 Tax=Lysobacter sp. 1R34A TaxID=3445786 RepID=UPI003EECF0AE
MEPNAVSRSPLRWAGSKKKLLPHLLNLAPKSFGRYIEPFCGSLCLYAALKPKAAVVGDINSDLIHFYKMIRWRPHVVAHLTHDFPGRADYYYTLRQELGSEFTAEGRAARFLYLNRYCFNGVYRTNKQGRFNVARGAHMGGIPSSEELVNFGRMLRSAELLNCDFEFLVGKAKENDFIYLDPPYAGRGVRDRGEYGATAFKASDFARLTQSLNTASQKKAKVLLSYADLPAVRKAFKDWNVSAINVARNVSGFARGRATVSELIVRNYD